MRYRLLYITVCVCYDSGFSCYMAYLAFIINNVYHPNPFISLSLSLSFFTPSIYQAILATGPFGHVLTATFLTSSIAKTPTARGNGKNQNSKGTDAVPKIC